MNMIRKILFAFFASLGLYKTYAQPVVQQQLLVSGLLDPTTIAHAGDNRLFVCEQIGRIRIINNGILAPTPFLNIQNKITSGGEQGLLGLAFSPAYATDSSFYVYYTDTNGIGNTVVSRFKVSEANPDSALASSEQILFTQTQPYTNHNGGCLQFGRDGYLYIALGDGGSGGDPQNFAQNPLSYLGKILRIDVSNTSATAYTIPSTNPFIGLSSILNEIWSIGWRNPWRFSFDKYLGEMWIGDVGQGLWEEIDREAYLNGGLNYGWRCREGAHNYNFNGCTASYIDPVYEYSHSATGGCSVTGGYVYRGGDYASLAGYYYYADYCNGVLYAYDYDNDTGYSALSGLGNITCFGEDQYGELYIGKSNGTVYKLVNTSNCTPNATVINTTGLFVCGDSIALVTPYNPGFIYQWFNNGLPIANAATNTYWASASGNYSVYVESSIACFDTSDVFFLGPCSGVNVNDVNKEIFVEVNPNPSSGNFNITSIGTMSELSYVITDAIGKTVASNYLVCDGSECSADVSLKTKGVYFVLVSDEKQIVARRKIILQ